MLLARWPGRKCWCLAAFYGDPEPNGEKIRLAAGNSPRSTALQASITGGGPDVWLARAMQPPLVFGGTLWMPSPLTSLLPMRTDAIACCTPSPRMAAAGTCARCSRAASLRATAATGSTSSGRAYRCKACARTDRQQRLLPCRHQMTFDCRVTKPRSRQAARRAFNISRAIGIRETATMPRATMEKLSLTTGTLPNA